MCGILGANTKAYEVRAGLRHLKRGGDETRLKTLGKASFAFQRHAVVGAGCELTQPYYSGGQLTLANGELFDFEQVRAELANPPAPGGTDIEVLHQFILEKGIPEISRLNMMIAGAVYKEAEQQLYLFRDWVGEEPLHYVYNEVDGSWCFGSTIAAVAASTRERLGRIREVTPGTIVKLSPWGESETTYFDIATAPPEVIGDDPAAEVRARLEASARARTWTKVPVAALVSGGTDSLITIYLLLKYGKFDAPLPLYTFHCDAIRETESSDLFHARRVVRFFGSKVEHRIINVPAAAILESIPSVVNALEDKRGRDFNVFTALYNRFLAEAIASDGIKVVYEGEGADEALGTYSTWRSWQITDSESGDPAFRRKMVGNLHKGVLPRTSKVMMNFGPLECRSFFLDREVQKYLVSLPVDRVRTGGRRKGVLVDAFSDVIPRELLERPKARPQDATGITSILELVPSEQLDFEEMFASYISQLGARSFLSWKNQPSIVPSMPPPA